MQSKQWHLKQILMRAQHYLKKAANSRQSKVIDANKFANLYCQPHLVRKRIGNVIKEILLPNQLRPNQQSYRMQYANQLLAEIHVKNIEENLLKDIKINESNEIIYANYALGVLSVAKDFDFKPRIDICRYIQSHQFYSAIKDISVELGLHSHIKHDSKIIKFPTSFNK